MANEGVKALGTVLSTYETGGNVTQTVDSAADAAEEQTQQNQVDAALAAAQLVESRGTPLNRHNEINT